MEVFVRDDLVRLGGFTEDGEARIGRLYSVVVQDDRGARAVHARSFADQAGANALQDKVAAHLAAGRALNSAHWVAIDPAYGSEAYQVADDAGYFHAREVLDAVDAGEGVAREVVAEAEARFAAVEIPDPLAA